MRSDVVSLVISISPHHRLNDCSWLYPDLRLSSLICLETNQEQTSLALS